MQKQSHAIKIYHQDLPDELGRYGKGITHSNGRKLAEMPMTHQMLLANTIFSHKMIHRTTLEAPLRRQ